MCKLMLILCYLAYCVYRVAGTIDAADIFNIVPRRPTYVSYPRLFSEQVSK